MKTRKILIVSVLVVLLAAGAGFAWRWYTTPVPPEVPLDGVEKATVQAIQEAREGVRRQPRSASSWGRLGMVLSANGFEEQALPCFEQAERFDPRDARWPYLRGFPLLEVDRPAALLLWQRAVDLARTPGVRAAMLFRLAMVLIEDGRLDEAGRHLQTLSDIEPDGDRIHYGFGLLCLARDDRAAARDHLRALAESPFARKTSSILLASLADGDEELARTCKQQAARLPKDMAWPDPVVEEMKRLMVDRMARIAPFWDLKKQGRHRESLDFLRRFVAEAPDAEVCFTLGFELYERGAFEEAAEVLRQSLRFDARNGKTHCFLGAALLGCGEKCSGGPDGKARAEDLYRQAIAAEDQALVLQSDFGYAHLTRGRALAHLGRTEEALAALRQALLCQPESTDMHLALGEALAEAGKLDEALVHLENAARLAGPEDARPGEVLQKWRARAKTTP